MGQRAIRLPGRPEPPGIDSSNCTLKKEFQRELHQPRIAGLGNLAELRAVGEITIWIEELRMVEDVEELSAEINALRLGNSKRLHDGEICVADVRPAADRAA